MSKIFTAFFAGVDYGKPNSVLPPFYESFLSELQSRGHALAVIPHNLFGSREWGGVGMI